MSGLPAWLTDNLLIVFTAILALIAFIIAWVVRRAAARREGDDADTMSDDDYDGPADRSMDPAIIDRKLDEIDLELDRPDPHDSARSSAARSADSRVDNRRT